MPLIRLSDVSIAFGVHALLDRANFQIDAGERVGLIGRNGEGKSTLLKMIAGDVHPDHGEVWRQPEMRVAMLEQAPNVLGDTTVYDAVADGLGEIGHWIAEYHALSANVGSEEDESRLRELGRLQHKLEAHDGWRLQQRVETLLSQHQLPADAKALSLSGGWQRRMGLARAQVIEPDLLLLDEPTNHLDFEAIDWLENELSNFRGAVFLVTHDRIFLQKITTRIVDLDRGQLVSWPGDYQAYLRRKDAALREEEVRNAEFDKRLADEETWIRQGIKARRTRNEGRVRALKKMREERAQRRSRVGTANLRIDSGEKSGKLVIEAKGIDFSFGDKPILKGFSTTILRGDRVGLIGPNGAGKSTLLQILLKNLVPDSGSLRHGTRLNIAYFDQQRARLDPEKTVVDTIGDGSEFINFQGRRVHVISYLNDFLFAPARARSPISSLSGGEKNRVLLALLFSRQANLLVMDEPTNDLDLETLELLEELLMEFDGTLLLVSHDRAFLDNVVTNTLVFEGEGRVKEYVGGYADWQRRITSESSVKISAEAAVEKPKADRPKKISFKERRELEALPVEIEELESRQAEINQIVASPEFYRNDQDTVRQTLEELQALTDQLEEKYGRWDELEDINKVS